jgi:hypothetical protein
MPAMEAGKRGSVVAGHRVLVALRWAVVSVAAAMIGLLTVIWVRFPAVPWGLFVAADGIVLIPMVWYGWRGIRAATLPARCAVMAGAVTGAGAGLVWVVEIGFNNLAPDNVRTALARGIVDNSSWAAISLVCVCVAASCAFRTRSFWSGVRAAYWNGLISGLAAALAGLVLVAFLSERVTTDPLMIVEYAQRGAGSGQDIATYAAAETTTGAIGHLLLIGVIFGVLLGLMGATIGRGLNRTRAR